MKCDVIICLREVEEAHLVLIDMQGFNPKTQTPQKITMMVPVCSICLAKYKGGHRVNGYVKILG